jgi:hypothetical protein
MAAIAALIFVVVAGYQDVRYYEGLDRVNWRAATAYVVSHGQPRDAVVFSPWYLSPPYEYYHARLRVNNGPQVVSGWEAADRSGSPTDEFLKTLPAIHPRIWLLYDRSTAPLDPRATATLARTYQRQQDFDFGGVGITLYGAR